MHDIRFQWKLGEKVANKTRLSVSVHFHKPPKNHLPCTTRHHFQHTPSTKTPASLGIRVRIWGGPWSHQRAWRMSVRRKPCRTRLIGGGSPPGAPSYENRGRIMPTVDTLHYPRKQGVRDDSQIPPGDSLSINLTIFVYGWLGDKATTDTWQWGTRTNASILILSFISVRQRTLESREEATSSLCHDQSQP